jgi:hypothetical protein
VIEVSLLERSSTGMINCASGSVLRFFAIVFVHVGVSKQQNSVSILVEETAGVG